MPQRSLRRRRRKRRRRLAQAGAGTGWHRRMRGQQPLRRPARVSSPSECATTPLGLEGRQNAAQNTAGFAVAVAGQLEERARCGRVAPCSPSATPTSDVRRRSSTRTAQFVPKSRLLASPSSISTLRGGAPRHGPGTPPVKTATTVAQDTLPLSGLVSQTCQIRHPLPRPALPSPAQ